MNFRQFFMNNKGSATVEFALLAPIFFMMIFGLVDFGRVYWTISSMEYAVEGGGRYAMINTTATSSQVITQAQAHLYAINTNNVQFTTSTSTSGGINYLTVQAQCNFNFIPGNLFPFSIVTLTRHVQVPLLP